MGILPLQFKEGQNAEGLGITGKEKFNIKLNGGKFKVKQEVVVKTDTGITFTAIARIDTELEIEYYRNKGILPFVIRKICSN